MIKIVVNTISTKKHSGGARQIAYNFLLETLKHQNEGIAWYYITSADMDDLVGDYFRDIKDSRYFVFPTQPDFIGSFYRVKKELIAWENKYQPDVIYSISSPCYFSFKTKEVMRFANAWITNPNKFAWKSMPLKARIRMYLYRLNQIRLLRQAKYIITQSETVKKGLVRLSGLPYDNIKVVPNVLPKVFADAKVEINKDEDWIDVISVATSVPHKNLDIIPEVLDILNKKYKIKNIRFNLTLPDGDSLLIKIFEKCKYYGIDRNVINHGHCTQQQLIDIYNRCNICFLPTLLETFSASSLEAMRFNLYIVATDFDFNREVIADAGIYFKPMCAEDAAEKIAFLLNSESLRRNLIRAMSSRLSYYNDYDNHFMQIVAFLKEVIK